MDSPVVFLAFSHGPRFEIRVNSSSLTGLFSHDFLQLSPRNYWIFREQLIDIQPFRKSHNILDPECQFTYPHEPSGTCDGFPQPSPYVHNLIHLDRF